MLLGRRVLLVYWLPVTEIQCMLHCHRSEDANMLCISMLGICLPTGRRPIEQCLIQIWLQAVLASSALLYWFERKTSKRVQVEHRLEAVNEAAPNP